MLLVGSGAKFVQQLEQAGALAMFVTPEGGSEGHYLRRLRGAGYEVVTLSSKGIGDLASYLTRSHGVRPATLGKSQRRTYFYPSLIEQYRATLPPKAKGLVFWFYEGHVLSQQELSYLVKLSQEDKGVKFVVELARERSIRWQPLESALQSA